MTYRAPNRLRAIRHQPRDRVKAGVHVVLGTLAGLVFLAVVIVPLVLSAALLSSKPALPAVDCEMARMMAAGMTLEQLKTIGTPEQRKQYAHCFEKPKKKHRPNMRRD